MKRISNAIKLFKHHHSCRTVTSSSQQLLLVDNNSNQQRRTLLMNAQHTGKQNVSFEHKILKAQDALKKHIKMGDVVFIHTGCAAPKHLLKNLSCLLPQTSTSNNQTSTSTNNGTSNNHKQHHHRADPKIQLVGLHVCYYQDEQPPHLLKENSAYFHTNSLFLGPHERKGLYEANRQASECDSPVDYLPIFLSEAPLLFKSGKFPIDVALISVSPPDIHGFCSLGVSVDISAAAVQCAKRVVAQINPSMPRTHGDGFIHVNNVDCFVECDEPIACLQSVCPSCMKKDSSLTSDETCQVINHKGDVITQAAHDIYQEQIVHRKIGEYVAELIPNKGCIQMGIGAIPNAICSSLVNHTDLGIHTETMSDGVLELFKRGVITNKYKTVHPGSSVCSFVLGSKELFDFVDDNPEILFRTSDFVNDGAVIKLNKNMIAINSAIEIDITGQVCADSIGTRIYSGVGGQLDFMSSSAKSEGGKPIIAIPSCTRRGDSKIVGILQNGAGVVTTRSHIHYVCTEYGIAELYGKNMRQRAKELIRVAHPKHRDRLIQEAKQYYGL